MIIKSTHNDQEINLYIPPRHKIVTVSVSGGADSALLLWHLLKYQKESNNSFKVIIYTSAGRNRTYFNFYHALKVQQWIFNYTQFDHNYSWCTFKHKDTTTSNMYNHMKIISKKFKSTLFISGRSSWPQSDGLKPYYTEGMTIGWNGFPITEEEKVSYARDKNSPSMENIVSVDPGANKWFSNDTYYYTPLIAVDKKWIWGSYKYYGIEDLWNTTRSCEGEQPILHQTCGKCWWCLEREWAKL